MDQPYVTLAADPNFCRSVTRDGALCHEHRGLRFCLYCGSYRCWRHVCEHLKGGS
jgi:hypothetical protein